MSLHCAASGSAKRLITGWLLASSIIAATTGAAIMPLITALQ